MFTSWFLKPFCFPLLHITWFNISLLCFNKHCLHQSSWWLCCSKPFEAHIKLLFINVGFTDCPVSNIQCSQIAICFYGCLAILIGQIMTGLITCMLYQVLGLHVHVVPVPWTLILFERKVTKGFQGFFYLRLIVLKRHRDPPQITS